MDLLFTLQALAKRAVGLFDEMEVMHYLADVDEAIARARNPAAFSA